MENMFSEVKVFKSDGQHGILARGSFVVGGAVKVQFTYREGKNGPFVALPSRKGQDKQTGEDKYYPHANFINKDAVAVVGRMVKEVYDAGGTQAGQYSNSGNSASVSAPDSLPF